MGESISESLREAIREIVREEIRELMPPKKTKKKPTPKLNDEEWLQAISKNPAYNHINIPVELSKMDAWLSLNPRRQKTRPFILNWLNKIPKPLRASANGRPHQQHRNSGLHAAHELLDEVRRNTH